MCGNNNNNNNIMEMSRRTRDETAEPVSRDQILRREQRRQGNMIFPCSAGHVQDWQPYLFKKNLNASKPSEHPPQVEECLKV